MTPLRTALDAARAAVARAEQHRDVRELEALDAARRRELGRPARPGDELALARAAAARRRLEQVRAHLDAVLAEEDEDR